MAIDTYAPNPMKYRKGTDPAEEDQTEKVSLLVNFYLADRAQTKALAAAKAKGKQKKIITVVADESAAGVTKRYFYEGDDVMPPLGF